MDSRYTTFALFAFGAAALTASLVKLKSRLELSSAKQRGLTGHARIARRVASLIPYYAYDETRFFRCDGAPEEIAVARQAGFLRLAALYRERLPRSPRPTAPA